MLTVTTGLKNKRVKLKQNGVEKSANNLWVYGSTWLQAEPGDNVFRYDAGSGIGNLEVLFPVRPPIGVYSLWNYMCLPKAVNFWA